MTQLYLDMDGVLADFDRRATEIFEMPPSIFERRYGSKAFWHVLQSSQNFYDTLHPMRDIWFLITAVQHLRPKILTGLPLWNEAEQQKRAWAGRYLPGYEVICCRSRDKAKYCSRGDILIDDRTDYQHLWEMAGGIYIVHTSAWDSIQQLKDLRII